MIAFIKFGENMSSSFKNIERFRKMTCNNPKLDLVNMTAYINFGENMSSSSQDIERKRNFGVKQGP